MDEWGWVDDLEREAARENRVFFGRTSRQNVGPLGNGKHGPNSTNQNECPLSNTKIGKNKNSKINTWNWILLPIKKLIIFNSKFLIWSILLGKTPGDSSSTGPPNHTNQD
jgi:hypothetical protein